jgi:Uma2 family endonuclease
MGPEWPFSSRADVGTDPSTPSARVVTIRLMALARQRMTADEYLALPPTDQNRRLELIDGELVMDAPKLPHQRIVFWLVYRIMSWIEEGPNRGEVLHPDVWLSQRDVYSPDLVWVGPEHPYPDDEGALRAPPELVVEVRSPSTWRHDRGRKRDLYEARGVAELWLIDHLTGTVEVHRRSSPGAPAFDERHILRAGDVLTTPLLPGLELDLTTLFGLSSPP